MLDDLIRGYKAAMEAREKRKAEETNALMAEIEEFHIQNAIDKALASNNKEVFLQLTGGINHANQT